MRNRKRERVTKRERERETDREREGERNCLCEKETVGMRDRKKRLRVCMREGLCDCERDRKIVCVRVRKRL